MPNGANFVTPHDWNNASPLAAERFQRIADNLQNLHERLTTPPSCRAFNSAALPTTNGIDFLITLNSERWDTHNMHSTSTQTSRLVVPNGWPGVYSIVGHVRFAGHATGYRAAYLRINGTTRVGQQDIPSIGANPMAVTAATLAKLAVGDYVEMLVWQNSGTGLNVESQAQYSPELTMTWISAG